MTPSRSAMLPADKPAGPQVTSSRYNCSRVVCDSAPSAASAWVSSIRRLPAIIVYLSKYSVRSSDRLAGIRLEAGCFDTGDAADLVLVRGVAADADRTDDRAAGV